MFKTKLEDNGIEYNINATFGISTCFQLLKKLLFDLSKEGFLTWSALSSTFMQLGLAVQIS